MTGTPAASASRNTRSRRLGSPAAAAPPPAAATTRRGVRTAERALHRRPDQRYQTGRAFREALVRVAEKLGSKCDREALGNYLRKLHDVPDDRPPPVRRTLKVTDRDVDDPGHWSSSVKARLAEVSAPPPAAISKPVTAPSALHPAVRPVEGTPVLSSSSPPIAVARAGRGDAGSTIPPPPPGFATVHQDADGDVLPPPVPVTGQTSGDEQAPTAMMDLAELAEQILGVDDDTDPLPGMISDNVHDGKTTIGHIDQVSQSEPVVADSSEASTRFVPAMTDEPDTTSPTQETQRPKGLSRASVGPAAVSGAHRAAPHTPLPPLAPNQEPASWLLLGVTALVWAGVVVIGVYAALLLVSR